MAKYPAMPLWTDAYLADTSHLSYEEHGYYLMILIHMWRAPNCRLPADDEWLRRKFRLNSAVFDNTLKPLLKEFCQCDGNWWTQKKLLKVWTQVQKSCERQSDRAKSAWRKRKPDTAAMQTLHSSGNATKTKTHIDSESPSLRQNLDTNLREPDSQFATVAPNGAGRPNGRRSLIEAFEEFWSCWDIPGAKRDKTAARRKYEAVIKAGVKHETLCDGVRQYMMWARRNRTELQFIKHPSTWLNKGCWSDELPDRNHQESTDEWAERIARETADEYGWGSH